MDKRVNKVEVNDWIVCPVSGLVEQVTRSEPRANGKRFLRTTRHDHNLLGVGIVTVLDDDAIHFEIGAGMVRCGMAMRLGGRPGWDMSNVSMNYTDVTCPACKR